MLTILKKMSIIYFYY